MDAMKYCSLTQKAIYITVSTYPERDYSRVDICESTMRLIHMLFFNCIGSNLAVHEGIFHLWLHFGRRKLCQAEF